MTNPLEIPGFIDMIGGFQIEELPDLVKKAAHRYEPMMTRFLRDLVRIPGESCNESDKIHRVKEEMKNLEFDEISIDPMGNLLGFMGSGSRIIAFDGHIDTVGIGELSNWTFDPYEGFESEDEIGGRGTSDQQGGIVSSVYGARIMKDLELIPEGFKVLVVASIQEEDCDGLCWQYMIQESHIRPEFVVSTEPTDGGIYRGQRGRMEIRVDVRGISCHGSAPERGDNAIYKMADILQDIRALNENQDFLELEFDALQEFEMDGVYDGEGERILGLGKMLHKAHNPQWKEAHFLGRGTITASEIFYSSPSRCAVADGCSISLDRRMTAGETWQSCLEEIRTLPSVLRYQDDVTISMYEYNQPSYTGLTYPIECYFPTWVIEEDHVITRTLEQVHLALFGSKRQGCNTTKYEREERALLDRWTFSTNGVSIMGRQGIPCIGYGPGAEAQAHAPNEKTFKADLVNAAAMYAMIPMYYVKMDD